MENKPYYEKTIKGNIEDVELLLSKKLKEAGFGVLVNLDIQETLKEKLEVNDFYPYKILGVCNPKLAYSALSKNRYVGLLLPCNMVLFMKEPGETTIALLSPTKALGLLRDPSLTEVGEEAERLLINVLEAI